MKMKEISVPQDQWLEILLGNLNKITVPAKKECKYLDKYFDDQDYISNVLAGCGPVIYEYRSPYGKVGHKVKVKGQKFKFTISKIRVDEKAMAWIIHFN